jgi:hypothetical protein
VFHAFYRELVQALYETGASHYVFCVNVDAVIAALLLVVLWKDYRSGALTEKDLETAAFNVFLYGRMIEAARRSTTTSIVGATWILGPRWSSVRSWYKASIAIISERPMPDPGREQ